MADLGIIMTDKRIRNLIKRLEANYSAAYKTAVENEKEWFIKVTSLPEDTPKEKREAFAREHARRQKVTNRIASEIARAGNTAAQMIQGEMSNIYGLNYEFSTYTINRLAGLDLDFTVYDRNQITVLMQEQESPFTKIAYNNLGKDKQIVSRLQNQMMQGIVNGESQRQLMRRIMHVTGQSLSQARRVVQTERTRIASQGRNMGIVEADAMGVECDKQWVARMLRTREMHEAAHLQIVGANEDFGEWLGEPLQYPGDPVGSAANVINCYCYIKPMVRSVSPALAEHREKFRVLSFEKYMNQRGVDYVA